MKTDAKNWLEYNVDGETAIKLSCKVCNFYEKDT